ncbi:hypothetical protein WS86_00205 (plasmid) [Burkholderia savannae]|uniref:Uncharacterized protein n=1 Tax=Burkholderia savannae TaxID=1637837 RepID=A0ABR5TBF2_9BURK|nr:hypothetical protein [Burkholderia savannae]AOJ79200.1 hypothetical protein WS86_00205 [Burkholderia savannae]KWZ39533.1 hypothetical protein WS72_19165 [Burkholderia savannae]
MNELPSQEIVAQVWAMVSPYISGGWAMLQCLWNESPKPVLIGVVVGMLLARVVRGILIVGVVAACAMVAVRVFGVAVPGLG